MDTPTQGQLERQREVWKLGNVNSIANLAAMENKSVADLDPVLIRDQCQFSLRCVKCGRNNLTSGILAFFKNDGNRLVCWPCQFPLRRCCNNQKPFQHGFSTGESWHDQIVCTSCGEILSDTVTDDKGEKEII